MEKEKLNEKLLLVNDDFPPFFSGKDKSMKKLKREDFSEFTDEEFEMIEDINNTPGEGPY